MNSIRSRSGLIGIGHSSEVIAEFGKAIAAAEKAVNGTSGLLSKLADAKRKSLWQHSPDRRQHLGPNRPAAFRARRRARAERIVAKYRRDELRAPEDRMAGIEKRDGLRRKQIQTRADTRRVFVLEMLATGHVDTAAQLLGVTEQQAREYV